MLFKKKAELIDLIPEADIKRAKKAAKRKAKFAAKKIEKFAEKEIEKKETKKAMAKAAKKATKKADKAPVEVAEKKTSAIGACFKAVKILIMILCPVIGILFAVYFWNIDQKVMAGLYKLVNQVFDEKKVDLNF